MTGSEVSLRRSPAQQPAPMQRLRAALKRFAGITLAVLLCACGAPRVPALAPGSAVLIVGDSISAGFGIDPAFAWGPKLGERTGWKVISAGVSGDDTAGGNQRLPALLAEHTPALVIIELGGNDLLRHVPEAQIVANLEAMIDAASARGARVVLMAAPKPTAIGAVTGLGAAGFYRDIAKRRGALLIEAALSSVLSDDGLRLDRIHPNVAGHNVLAQRTVDELRPTGILPVR
jgi:acyl-CoA thioesterase I